MLKIVAVAFAACLIVREVKRAKEDRELEKIVTDHWNEEVIPNLTTVRVKRS